MTAPDPQFVDDVLAAVRASRVTPGAPYPYEILAEQYPAEAVMEMMDRLSSADILDYGVSLRTAWVCEYLPDLEARIAAVKAGQDYEPAES